MSKPFARYRLVLALCGLFLSASSVRAQAATGGGYERTVSDALSEYNTGNFLEAQALFERAHALRPSARTLRGLGMTHFELKKYVRAQSALRASLDDTRQPLTAAQRADVESLLQRVDAYIARLEVRVQPKSARVFIDGEPVTGTVSVDLGEHDISVTADGYHPHTRRVSLDGGKHQTIDITLLRLEIAAADAARSSSPADPAPMARPSHDTRDSTPLLESWWFWTAVGAVVAGSVVAAVVLTSRSEREALEPGDTGGAFRL